MYRPDLSNAGAHETASDDDHLVNFRRQAARRGKAATRQLINKSHVVI
jgi:hypothetical protein